MWDPDERSGAVRTARIVSDQWDLCDNFTMIAAVRVFWGICIFRDGPERAPSHPAFVLLLLLVDLLFASAMFATLTDLSAIASATEVGARICISGVLIWVALRLANHPERFSRAFAAILGADILIGSLMALALIATGGNVVLALPFTIWNVAISAFILHRAMEVPMVLGASTAIVVFILTNTLVEAWS